MTLFDSDERSVSTALTFAKVLFKYQSCMIDFLPNKL